MSASAPLMLCFDTVVSMGPAKRLSAFWTRCLTAGIAPSVLACSRPLFSVTYGLNRLAAVLPIRMVSLEAASFAATEKGENVHVHQVHRESSRKL
jgi:hypothetical protein